MRYVNISTVSSPFFVPSPPDFWAMDHQIFRESTASGLGTSVGPGNTGSQSPPHGTFKMQNFNAAVRRSPKGIAMKQGVHIVRFGIFMLIFVTGTIA